MLCVCVCAGISMAGVSESEDEEDDPGGRAAGDLTYVQEQNQLRKSFQEAASIPEGQEDEDASGTGGGLLVLRKKTQEEKVREEAWHANAEFGICDSYG